MYIPLVNGKKLYVIAARSLDIDMSTFAMKIWS